MNVLYISNSLPYESVRHAGGKTFNYYVNNIVNSDNCKVKVIGLCKKDELKKIDRQGNIELFPVITRGDLFTNIKRVLTDVYGKIFRMPKCDGSYYKYKYIFNQVNEISFSPDIIILEWTNMVLLCDYVRKIFPKAKILASEHDVNFLGLYRKYEITKTKKSLKYYKKEKNKELNALNSCDKVLVQNNKDKDLLVDNGIDEKSISVISPFYHDMSMIKRKNINNDLLFWGAMYRSENYEAAIWFIKNVMPLLADINVRFIIAGNRPPNKLKELQSNNIVVTGFVEDETELFEHSLCFVSPLLTGAGIKVKIIEAMSSGIPVLTNNIGIEGIYAKKGLDYYHCESAEDYSRVIRKLIIEGENEESLISRKSLIQNNYNLRLSADNYLKIFNEMIGETK